MRELASLGHTKKDHAIVFTGKSLSRYITRGSLNFNVGCCHPSRIHISPQCRHWADGMSHRNDERVTAAAGKKKRVRRRIFTLGTALFLPRNTRGKSHPFIRTHVMLQKFHLQLCTRRFFFW